MAFFKHDTALVETDRVGEGTEIRAFSHVLPGAAIGCDCIVCDHTFIDNGVLVGDRVTLGCGVQLWDGVRIEDDVFIGPNATFAHAQRPGQLLPTVVKKGASIGANATILPGLTIEEQVIVEAGTVVTRNVPRNAVVTGNPGRIVGYAGVPQTAPAPSGAPVETGPQATTVGGVILERLPLVADLRGMLSFAETGRHIPFTVKRYFLVFDVATEQVRGEHAHRTLHQFLVCVHGRCCVVADDGAHRQEFTLDSPHTGLYLPPMTWSVQYKHSPDSVLLALASDVYDPADYIRDYAEFLALRRGA